MNPHAPQFVVGQHGVAGGVAWRTVRGDKAPDDIRIEWRINGRWIPVCLDVIFVAIDLICQNEDRLYPYPMKGGQLTISAIREAREKGCEHAIGWLHLQRQNREAKARKDWVA